MKAKEALVGSFKMLKEKPKFVLPMIVLTILGVSILGVSILGVSIVGLTLVTEEAVTPQEWYLLGSMFFVLMILISVVSILVYGMYPSMVKDHIEKKELNLKTSFLFACHKFWSLLGASLLVILILSGISSAIGISLAVLFYTISLDLPIAEAVEISGAIIMMIVFPFIVVFFHYISSAIIMDDLKAVEGFGRSWKVGKKNYLFTLLICLVPVLIGYVIYGLSIGLPFYYLGVEMGDTTFYAVTSLFYRLLIGLPFLGAGIGYIFTLLILTARSIFALIIPYTIFYHFYIFLHFEFTWPTYPGTAISNISILLIPYAIIVLFIGAWTAIIQSYAYYGLRA